MTSNQSKLFRKVAMERLSSPEQLDQLGRVISPAGWLALLALLGIVVLAAIWSVYGTIPTKVVGPCVLIGKGGVLEVSLPTGGRIIRFDVQVGDLVQKGQTVGYMEQSELFAQVYDLKAARSETINKNKKSRDISVPTFNQIISTG